MSYRIVCGLLVIFACFYGLGSYPLFDNNEGLYAAIASHMLQRGDLIIPHLNDVPYIEKPPLLYWLMAFSMSLLGVNEWAARLPTAIAFLMTAWLIRRFLLRHDGSENIANQAALIFTTSLPLLMLGRTILFDMTMTCFLTAALLCFYESFQNKDKHFYGFYLFLALAVLTKGLVALSLAGGTIIGFLIWQRSSVIQYKRILSLRGIALFILIAAPWHMMACLKDPGFAYFYFINEHLFRFLDLREPHDYHTGPIWHYLPCILIHLSLWAPFLILLGAFFKRGKIASQMTTFSGFLWAWFLFYLLFFSLAGNKSDYYMMAGMPPLAMLLSIRITASLKAGGHLVQAMLSIIFLFLASLGALVLWLYYGGVEHLSLNGQDFLQPLMTLPLQGWPTFLIGALVLYGMGAMVLCWRIPIRWVTVLLASVVLLLLPLALILFSQYKENFSQKSMAEFLRASSDKDIAIFYKFDEFSSLAFYLAKPLTIVDNTSPDLLYGKQKNTASQYFVSLSAWASRKETLPLIVKNSQIQEVLSKVPEVCVIKSFKFISVLGGCASATLHVPK
jgi:4-amino-4-deoxy-L-arabinose transferase-like glycosyltransferase